MCRKMTFLINMNNLNFYLRKKHTFNAAQMFSIVGLISSLKGREKSSSTKLIADAEFE